MRTLLLPFGFASCRILWSPVCHLANCRHLIMALWLVNSVESMRGRSITPSLHPQIVRQKNFPVLAHSVRMEWVVTRWHSLGNLQINLRLKSVSSSNASSSLRTWVVRGNDNPNSWC